jgi:hypothetical protein
MLDHHSRNLDWQGSRNPCEPQPCSLLVACSKLYPQRAHSSPLVWAGLHSLGRDSSASQGACSKPPALREELAELPRNSYVVVKEPASMTLSSSVSTLIVQGGDLDATINTSGMY